MKDQIVEVSEKPSILPYQQAGCVRHKWVYLLIWAAMGLAAGWGLAILKDTELAPSFVIDFFHWTLVPVNWIGRAWGLEYSEREWLVVIMIGSVVYSIEWIMAGITVGAIVKLISRVGYAAEPPQMS